MFPAALKPSILRHDGVAVRAAAPASSAAVLRAAVLLGCAAAIGVAVHVGDPAAYLVADPALARLLRCMALIKGLLVVCAVAAVLWRCGWPVSRPVAAAYAGGCWMLAGSTMMIWQLSMIPVSAVLFHAAAFGLLLVGWREKG
jgi:hypothetical protein